MNVTASNNGQNDIDITLYSPAYPTLKDLYLHEAGYDEEEDLYTVNNQKHRIKSHLIVKGNKQGDFPIFVENVYWNWIKFEEYAIREYPEVRDEGFKSHFVNIQTEPHAFTIAVYKKQNDPSKNPPSILNGDEYICTDKKSFHKGINLDFLLMNDRPETLEDINSPIWLYVVRGIYT